MDALDCYRGDDSTVSEHPLLGETTNDNSDVESPVFRLPTELTRLIFGECGSDIPLRLTLTHTCHRWREIAVNDASLWTNVCICTIPRNSNSRLDHFLSFLGMQLDRTGSLLLDVIWIAKMGDEFFVATLKIIRERAPFSRWRSLWVDISAGSHVDAPWFIADRFTSLESLIVFGGTSNIVISAIDRTITSRLKILEVAWYAASPERIMMSFAKSLGRITSLRLHSLISTQYRSFLPANIVDLELDNAGQHPFPHVHTYTLMECIFTQTNSIDLRNMTTLIVSKTLRVCLGCHLLLPTLRELRLGSLTMEFAAKIEATALDILYFITPSGFGLNDMALLSDTDSSLREEGYHLSPNVSVIADSYLPSSTVLDLLAKSPQVTHVTLRFDDWTGAQAVLEKLAGIKAESDPPPVEHLHLCPRLSELRLDFHWALSEPSASKEWLLNALKARKESGLRTPLSIYARWKGEGAYVLITSD